MNIKALIPIVIGTLVALAAWQLVVKKLVVKDEFEADDD